MSNDRTATTRAEGPRAGLRARLGGLNITRRRGALGVPEIAALGVAALLLMTAVLSYLFLLAPQRSRKNALEAERGDLQRKLQDQQSVLGQGKDTQQRVGEILTSLTDFEVGKLGQASSGSKTVIEEMNRLIVKNHLRISGGVSFTQLQETVPGADQSQSQRREDGAQRIVQSVFPGIGVTLTVEGTYANLRHFIRDIEADRQFVVIDAVELEGVTDSNASAPSTVAVQQAPLTGEGLPAAPPAAAPSTPSRGALVSLRLDMAAYFRRANVVGAAQ
ncbi:MAG TPA: GspMb/PilO family protein [Pyrinomonadaceae bacterium]|nr:GspMb/PilO family protein [Pyrinomonadaceae bacterium]